MTITARVAISLFLITGILVGALAHQLSQVEKLQAINREVSLIKLEAARISVRLLQGLDGVEEFAAKWALLGDPDYLPQWQDWEEAVDEDLRRLGEVGLSEPEEGLRLQMQDRWAEYETAAAGLASDPVALLPGVEEILSSLREDTSELISANEAAVADRAAASAAAAEQARRIAWIATAAAVLLAGLLSILLVTSISRPLRRLTRGTRELARGRFEHRLRVTGPAELQSLGRDFNRMAAQLGELERLKRDFLSHVSHELKTPLAAIQETIEIFLDEVPGPLTPKQARLMGLSRRSSQRLASMISNLLEISRLEAEADAYHPAWHDLAGIVAGVLEEAEPLAQEQDLRLALRYEASDARLVCDGGRLAEVFGNLVGNAIKFSPAKGEVLVTISDPEGDPGVPGGADGSSGTASLLILVEDEGPGVPDSEKERIFEKFRQVPGPRRAGAYGVGLGLAIVKRIVEAHGGVVTVEDRPGGGSVFRVELPKVPPRWRERVAPDPGATRSPGGAWAVAAEGPVPAGAHGPSRARTIHLTGLALAVLMSGGCLPFQEGGLEEGPSAEESPTAGVQAPPGSPTESAASRRISADGVESLLVTRGWTLLADGRFEDARTAFAGVRDETGAVDPELRREALWGLVMVHLLPDSPVRDPGLAVEALRALEEGHRGELPGLQAVLVRELVEELAGVRSVAQEQEEVLRRLVETVEALKRIDLTRRPSREARPDSIDGGPGAR
jgi:signal transduction histidine kinase